MRSRARPREAAQPNAAVVQKAGYSPGPIHLKDPLPRAEPWERGLAECVSVNITKAQEAIRILKGLKLLAPSRPVRREDRLYLPVIDSTRSLRALAEASIDASPCSEHFEPRRAQRLSDIVPGLSGFLRLGSIVVLNYNSEVGFQRYIKAAEALKDIYRDLSSVFLKLGTTGELRLPELVLIYGDGNTLTRIRENGLEFLVDVKRAYFNPRLSGERARVANMVNDGELVLDMFSGVGPFAITIAARASAEVLSVDLNPYASYLAALNVMANRKKLKGSVTVLRADSKGLPEIVASRFDRIIMNNPTLVLEFAEAACQLSHDGTIAHVYILSRSEEEALKDVTNAFRDHCGGLTVLGHRRVLEHSPSKYVFSVELALKGQQEG